MFRKTGTPWNTLRQHIANGRIEFRGPIPVFKPEDRDHTRVHDIINEIDGRRVFYEAYEDEMPQRCLESVRDARAAVQSLRQGVWASSWSRMVVQIMIKNMGDFLTEIERRPLPAMGDAQFELFEDALELLRMQTWSLVAHLELAYGTTVSPLNIPPEVMARIKESVGLHSQQ
jgi:hypothetical protein